MAIVIDPEEWQQMYTSDIKEKFQESQQEFIQFQKTQRAVFLQQAGNKLFSVVENHLMLKHGKLARSYQHLKEIIKDDTEDRILLADVARLHFFFYQNELAGDIDDFEFLYERTALTVKKRLSQV
ncbi:MAG: hypothetical protein ACI8Y7_000926 [Candidatus Woesearchaeota archaeon]|jgi:hypothetical protein